MVESKIKKVRSVRSTRIPAARQSFRELFDGESRTSLPLFIFVDQFSPVIFLEILQNSAEEGNFPVAQKQITILRERVSFHGRDHRSRNKSWKHDDRKATDETVVESVNTERIIDHRADRTLNNALFSIITPPDISN